jgi:hypothetical protein
MKNPEEMTTTDLLGAIRDIRKTLPLADAMDREMGTDNGGRYRDEAAAYHQELAKRRKS